MTTAQLTLDFTRIKHNGRAPQQDFINNVSDFYPAYLGGVGTGKSMVLVVDAMQYASEVPGSRQIITEPSFPMVQRVIIPAIDDIYGPLVGEAFHMTRHPPIEVKMPNGSEIWMMSTDVHPQRLYGTNVARVLMDEVTLGNQQEAFNILTQRCRQPGMLCQLKVSGTAKGRNWVYQQYFERPMRGAVVSTAHTQDAEDAGILPQGYVERILNTYGGWDSPLARQELLGEFLRLSGPVFPQFSRRDHIRDLTDDEVSGLRNKLGGIDFGAISPTALICTGLDTANRARAFAEWYHAESTLDDLIEAMGEMRERYGVTEWVSDPAGKHEAATLRSAGFSVRPARHGNDIKLRAQLVGARLNVDAGTKLPGLFISNSCPNLITELETLSWKRVRVPGKAEEIMNDEFERGAPDHAFDAFANCLSEYDQPPRPWKRPPARNIYPTNA